MEQSTAEERKPQLTKRQRVLVAWLIALAAVAVVVAIYIVGTSDSSAAKSDFISYWAAGHLLVHGQNPYDFQAVRALELGAGRNPAEQVLIMRNPPVAFFMALPFGWSGPKAGAIIWQFVLLGALSLASFLIWQLNGRPDSLFNYFGFAFAPVLVCLMLSQCGILVLLGIALFLYFCRNRPFFAGGALLLCALKPHFFAPFGAALFLWCLAGKKRYLILAGFGVALAASCALAYALDPHAWSQYSQLVRTGGALNEVVPELGPELRLLIDPHAVWIQFAPQATACAWAVWYFWSRRKAWDWMDHGLVLLLVGSMCAPYGFLADESLLLPAVLAGVFCAVAGHRAVWPLVTIAIVALFEVGIGAPTTSRWYLWTTPAWLCWYLYATGRLSRPVGGAAA